MVSARPVRAQQKATPVIGFLNGGSADKFAPYFVAFRNGLAAMGYVEDQNVAIECRNAEGQNDRLAGLQEGARVLKIHLSIVRVTTEPEIDEALASVSQQGAGAVIIVTDPLFQDRRDQLVALQNCYTLPAVFGGPEFPRLGG